MDVRLEPRVVLEHAGGLLAPARAHFVSVPSSVICYLVARVWNRYRGRPWHQAFEAGLAPIGAGLMFAGVVAILALLLGVILGA